MDERVNTLLPLAAKIAREFGNIPGLPFAEIELTAQEALANAARLFDPEKGDFTSYAARAMRNALRDLYERQQRHHRHHAYILDEPVASGSATITPEARVHGIPSPVSPSPEHVAIRESRKRLEIAMSCLSPRLRVVTEGIRDGNSYSEIGSSLGISKQTAHKLAGAAITALREKLESMGFAGVDTPVFMPPEQITNFKYVKPVSDVWSFAASLYQLLTGKFPYRFDPKRDPIDIILNENPVPIRERMPGLEKNLAAVIDQALVRDPKARFADAGKLLAAIPIARP